MIPGSAETWQSTNWQYELNHLIEDPAHLLRLVELDEHWLPAARKAAEQFPLRATASFVNRIVKGDPADPLLRQILPLQQELDAVPGFELDPLAERQFNPVPGLVHKYRSRVLLIAATQCAINCRYCFRRHFPYQDNSLNRPQWQTALEYVRANGDINEVILSGGDPLSISDRQLQWLVDEIAAITHIKRLRIHSRYPVILPSRVTDGMVAALSSTRLQTVVVIHCNHPQEIDRAVEQSLASLRMAGVQLLNQTVLLKGINDRVEVLSTLSEKLFECGVLPYYVHLLDRVQGAAHFLVPDAQAQALYRALLSSLSGYLVPRFVRELPHAQSKIPLWAGLDHTEPDGPAPDSHLVPLVESSLY